MTTSQLHLESKKNIALIIKTLALQGIVSKDIEKDINNNLFRIEDNPLEMLREMVIHNNSGYYEVMKDGVKHKITVKMEVL